MIQNLNTLITREKESGQRQSPYAQASTFQKEANNLIRKRYSILNHENELPLFVLKATIIIMKKAAQEVSFRSIVSVFSSPDSTFRQSSSSPSLCLAGLSLSLSLSLCLAGLFNAHA